MIGADNPDRAVGLEDAAAFPQPFAREAVIGREILETVPGVIDAVHPRIVGAEQIAAKLQVIGRIGENEIGGARWQAGQYADAIAFNDAASAPAIDATPGRLRTTHDKFH